MERLFSSRWRGEFSNLSRHVSVFCEICSSPSSPHLEGLRAAAYRAEVRSPTVGALHRNVRSIGRRHPFPLQKCNRTLTSDPRLGRPPDSGLPTTSRTIRSRSKLRTTSGPMSTSGFRLLSWHQAGSRKLTTGSGSRWSQASDLGPGGRLLGSLGREARLRCVLV